MKTLREALAQSGVLVSDGAWGTFLQEKGLAAGACPESWNLDHPGEVMDIALSYINAGADMILTNSFGGNPFKLSHYSLEGKAYDLNRAAAEISRKAAGDKIFVLGSVGPTGMILLTGDVTAEELLEAFRIQISGLIDGGADAVLIETMSDLEEASLAIKAAKGITKKEVICTMTFTRTPQDEYRTMMGVSPEEAAEFLVSAGADIIGANCGNGTAGMIDIVKLMRKVNTQIPVLVHANAGIPVYKDGKTIFPETASEMAKQVRDLVAAGANIIGGCCGTTTEHIRQIAAVVRSL